MDYRNQVETSTNDVGQPSTSNCSGFNPRKTKGCKMKPIPFLLRTKEKLELIHQTKTGPMSLF